MILCYHKVFPVAKTHWWLTVDRFFQQMAALQGYNVVSLDDYDSEDHNQVVITFDGVYDNILSHAAPIMKRFGYPFELFVIGDWIGRDNTFDQAVEPSCHFANLEQLDALVSIGGRVQWHTRSHRRFTELERSEAVNELCVPDFLRRRYGSEHLAWFAYPHGAVDDGDREIVRSSFRGALACDDGNPRDQYNLPRTLVFEHHDFFRSRTAVCISLGSRPWLIRDTLDTVNRQAISFDKIIIDAAANHQQDVIKPIIDALETAERNNVTIQYGNGSTQGAGDYLVEMMAGDRLRSDYNLACRVALDKHQNAIAVATDVTNFDFGLQKNHTHNEYPKPNRPSANAIGIAGHVGLMRRVGKALQTNEALHINAPLYESRISQVGSTSESVDESELVRELCIREAELIQRAAIIKIRDQEINRLNSAYAVAAAEIERCNREHTLNASEIMRLNLAYGTLETELRRVNEAYGALSAEFIRVNDAYRDLSGEISANRSPAMGRDLGEK